MKKAQGSFEILFAIGFMTFIFLVLIYFTFERRSELYNLEEIVNEKGECFKLSNIITSSFVSGDGTNITLKLDYDAKVEADEGIISTGSKEYPCNVPLNSIRSSSGESSFSLSKGLIVVETINSTVVMRNV